MVGKMVGRTGETMVGWKAVLKGTMMVEMKAVQKVEMKVGLKGQL